MNTPHLYERTHYEAVLDIRYGVRLNLLLRRLYGRIATSLSFCELFAGAGAFGAFMSSHASAAGWVGLFLAALTVFNNVIKPSEKVAQADELMRRYEELFAKSKRLTLEALDEELATLRQFPVPNVEPLRLVAFNDVQLENGRYDAVVGESSFNKFFRMLA